MPFIRKSTLTSLQGEVENLRVWKALTLEIEAATNSRMSRLEEEADQLYGFLHFLQTEVPDYDGYVLQYMEKVEADGSQ